MRWSPVRPKASATPVPSDLPAKAPRSCCRISMQRKGEEAAERIQADGGDAVFIACDAGDKDQIEALIAGTVAAFGRLDCAIPNAGIVHACDFLDLEVEDFDRVLRVNLRGRLPDRAGRGPTDDQAGRLAPTASAALSSTCRRSMPSWRSRRSRPTWWPRAGSTS